MRRTIVIAMAASLSIALGPHGPVAARVHVNVGIAVPPPPVVAFEREPEVVLVPKTKVYYLPGYEYDMYRYGGYWYIYKDGYWFRAPAYAGPFVPVAYGLVPRVILTIPAAYRHHPFHPRRWYARRH